jgi:hypothetical protein
MDSKPRPRLASEDVVGLAANLEQESERDYT